MAKTHARFCYDTRGPPLSAMFDEGHKWGDSDSEPTPPPSTKPRREQQPRDPRGDTTDDGDSRGDDAPDEDDPRGDDATDEDDPRGLDATDVTRETCAFYAKGEIPNLPIDLGVVVSGEEAVVEAARDVVRRGLGVRGEGEWAKAMVARVVAFALDRTAPHRKRVDEARYRLLDDETRLSSLRRRTRSVSGSVERRAAWPHVFPRVLPESPRAPADERSERDGYISPELRVAECDRCGCRGWGEELPLYARRADTDESRRRRGRGYVAETGRDAR